MEWFAARTRIPGNTIASEVGDQVFGRVLIGTGLQLLQYHQRPEFKPDRDYILEVRLHEDGVDPED